MPRFATPFLVVEMRALSPEETETLRVRKAGFERFAAERLPVLRDFAAALGLSEPARIAFDPAAFLPTVDAFMKHQVVEPDDYGWIMARLAYFVGDCLVQSFSGCWFVNEIPESRTFLRYVVGRFARIENTAAMVDPFEVVRGYLIEPPGRDLRRLLGEVRTELLHA